MDNPNQAENGRLTLEPVAWYRGDLPEKFGLPRQSGLVPQLQGRVEMATGFRQPEMLRGLEGFSHVWLVWGFSRNHTWSPTVRPPRLGGNTRLGVFATRSPFRPNPIGLSLVELDHIDWEGPQGPQLWVKGADLMDGTPIYDIKPYVPYADARPDARSGFARGADRTLEVQVSPGELEKLPEAKRQALVGLLSQDPRPHYQNNPERIYGLTFDRWNVKFRVADGRVLVTAIEPLTNN
ncbi:tRNA (N6-threonylcarbamoyladenosine(37)-N6)-methyltransferase TrmO [Acidaminococcus timonensis]|uniref:tRNA (N6-threonylcarbamoyladenosine(37)-N6)-methyltransferase TrmO n=1 Tax=Acidaminococcus timonensis TaxID=1871002 RepID=UPI0025FD2FCC|nr:tRNA (N6-threonylcarbamoyladenosine(37)-N6)-methyltransferase TrmO [Acidaminococcus timonensis]